MTTSLGALWLKGRQTFAHGPRVAWYRDVVRPRILASPPITGTLDNRCEIHALTSSGDWLNLMWGLKSFYATSGRSYALCIHDDGSLDVAALGYLARHFPDARIVSRKEADVLVEERLRDFPLSREFRRSNPLAPKIFDFAAYLEADRMVVFDSDLLFFAAPTEFLRRVEDPAYTRNTFNADAGDAYAVDRDVAKALIGHELIQRFNSGFGLAHRQSLRLDWIEEFLGLPGLRAGHFWRIEQTLYALCSSRFGVELLPREYTLDFVPGINGRPFRHYVGGIRHLMYGEGMAELSKRGLLRGALFSPPSAP